jgi:hypothetical protein
VSVRDDGVRDDGGDDDFYLVRFVSFFSFQTPPHSLTHSSTVVYIESSRLVAPNLTRLAATHARGTCCELQIMG